MSLNKYIHCIIPVAQLEANYMTMTINNRKHDQSTIKQLVLSDYKVRKLENFIDKNLSIGKKIFTVFLAE